MKICLFGGTFDPPHLGHLLIAQTVCEAEDFDKIIFIPAFNPPNKNLDNITPVSLRLEMLESAISDNPRFEISQMEIQRGGTSYSLDTISEFKYEYQLTKNDLYYLIGSDTLAQFDLWKDPKTIVNECSVWLLCALDLSRVIFPIGSYLIFNLRTSQDLRFQVLIFVNGGRKTKQYDTW